MAASALPRSFAPPRASTSLRRQTLISFGAAAAILLLLLTAVVIALSALSESNQWRDTLTDIASRSEDQIAIFLQRGSDLLTLLDSINAAESEQDEPEHLASIITSILTTNPGVHELALIRPDGAISDTAPTVEPLLDDPAVVTTTAWYQTALAGDTYFGAVEFTADNIPIMILAQPLSTGGVVAAVLNMNVLRDAIALFDDEDPTITYVVSATGTVVLHPDADQIPAGTTFPDQAALQQVLTSPDDSITLEYTSFNNMRVLGAFNAVDRVDWFVVRETARDGIFTYTRNIALGLVIGITLLGIGIVIGANRFLSRFYFQPLEQLRTASEHVQQGDLGVRLQPRVTDEIGLTMHAFNEMTTQLQAKNQLGQQLFELSQRIANAHTPQDLTQAIFDAADPSALVGVNFTYVETNARQEPATLTIAAVRFAAGATPTVQAGMTFRVTDVPFAKLWLMNKQEPVFIEDVRTDPRVDDTTRGILLAANAIRNVFIPVTQSGRWLAVVPVSWSEARPFTAQERELYTTLPALLAPIADNLRLIEDLEANVQQIVAAQTQTQALYTLSQQFANARSYHDVIQAILTDAHVPGAFYINFTRVETADDGSRTLIYAAHQSANAAPFPIPIGQRFDFDAFPFARLLEGSQSALLLDDVLNAPGMDAATRGMLELVGVASVALLPLTQADRWIGLISIGWSQPHTFTEQERAFYRTLPVLAAPVMDNLNLIAQLEANVQALSEARARAEDSNRLKGEFLSTMSHELRTPLNAIEGFTGIMLTGMGGFELDPAPRRMVERVRLNSRRLLGLVNDFLDLSRIEAGRIEIVNEAIQPAKLAARWTAEIGVLAENKGLALSTEIDPDLPAVLLGDEDALTKIAANLLSNAVKFTEQGRITLRLFRTGEQWAIQVQDTGIGIPKAAQGYIFDEFRQVDGSTTRKYGGTGLGLAIVQKFVRLINGRIQLESDVDRGSTFTVYVPLLLPTTQPITQPVTA